MYLWTNEEMEAILIQLDEQEIPFAQYTFTRKAGRLQRLGQGGFALVYEAESRNGGRDRYAVKVIGFGDRIVDSAFFKDTVDAQKNLGFLQENIVKIYDYREMTVQVGDDGRVAGIRPADAYIQGENSLKLRFVLMEKLSPVLTAGRFGRVRVAPERLAASHEKEILKFACDIGSALSHAHKHKMLHRDVKLENIFYAQRGKHYKLGDFGIARVTKDGMASTAAFTMGYGAPEVVGSLEEKYDNTADIYSFGMLLYLLLNDLHFPDSDHYGANLKVQYGAGYVFPRPRSGSDALCRIVEKMCRYDPDDRYQSMDEALDDLEALAVHAGIRYRREHKETSLAVGALLLWSGAAVWKLAFMPEYTVVLSKTAYLFLVLSAWKWMIKLRGRNVVWVSAAVMGLGIWLLVSQGFSWVRLLLLLCVSFSSGDFSGLFAGTVLAMNAATLAGDSDRHILSGAGAYRWVALTLLSMAVVLLLQYLVLRERDRTVTSIYLGRNRYWVVVCGLYAVILTNGCILQNGRTDLGMPGELLLRVGTPLELIKTGAAGILFCIIWNIREYILRGVGRRERNRPG